MGRFREPSTWAGIAAIFAGLASMPIPVTQPWFGQNHPAGLAGVAGSVAVALRETSQKDADVAKQ